MSLTNIFNISGSGMSAQTVRLNTTASNLANAESVSSSVGETYKARHPVFASAMASAFGMDKGGVFDSEGGVKVLGVVESNAPYQIRYEPHHPMANGEGYVTYPNVNVMEEMTNMISSSRSFQMNVEVMNTAKTMMQRVMSLGQ
jgi:flagellar basal-body rod protein FlgC